MIEFAIAAQNLRYIMKSLSGLALANVEESRKRIKFEHHGGWLKAYATDGHRLHSAQVPILSNGPDFAFVMEPLVLPETTLDMIPCAYDPEAGEITFQTEEWTGKKKTYDAGEFLDVGKVLPGSRPVARIGINPKYLLEAVKPFAGKDCERNPIAIEIRGETDPVIIYRETNREELRVIMPVQLRTKESARQEAT